MRFIVAAASLGLAACIGLAALVVGPANAKVAAKSAKVSPAVIAAAKATIAQNHCDSCHSADLHGKPGFSPSITGSGMIAKYSKASFVKLLKSGVTVKGTPAKPPMSAFPQVSSHSAAALYTYLASLK